MSSYLAGFSRRQVRSTTDTLAVGTRKAMPVSFPFSSGMTLPTALAAPVEVGMMFWRAPRPSRHSFPEGPSTVFWVAVMAWTVVMSSSTIPKLSWMTLARGAKQLVVQEALLTILRLLSYFSCLDSAMEFAMGGIILEHVDHVVEVNEGIIDGDDIHFTRVKSSSGDQAPDMTKSVDSDLHLPHGVSGMWLAMGDKMRLSVEQEEQRA
uniref:Uncharacterized protein n=1 Tax=Callithrix jacchus TaxID=9483 RepID=F7IM79_CALJA